MKRIFPFKESSEGPPQTGKSRASNRAIGIGSGRRGDRSLAALLTAVFLMGGAMAGRGSSWLNPPAPAPAAQDAFAAPSAIVASPGGDRLYVACEATGEVLILEAAERKVTARVRVDEKPSGLAVSRDGKRLYATCAGVESTICVIDTAEKKVAARWRAGYQAQSPVLSPDERRLYVCNRFNNDVSVFDVSLAKEIGRIPVAREPFAAAVTPDGKRLLVANHIHSGRADVDVVASSVTVLDLNTGCAIKEIALPNGSTLLREIRVSPDGRYAVVAHILARFHLPTTQIERGWINTNAGSMIDLEELKLLNTVLLDNIDSGAAIPWAVAWSADGRQLLMTHSGTHELSVIDFPALLAKLAKVPEKLEPGKPIDYTAASRVKAEVPNDLSFLVGVRQRIKLPGRGPRSVAVAQGKAWVAQYYSDTVDVVKLPPETGRVETVALGLAPQMTVARIGEFYFNDATICFQGWQACASCHSHDARVDGLNWDNLNDGIGNPKNVKSLLLAHETPPAMWLGVRSNAVVAVRAGIRNSLFTVQPPEVAESIDEYLKSLRPMPSPALVKGELSPAAQRGKAIFSSEAVGCADCHKGPAYTDLKFHDVGTASKFDQNAKRFDTPTLIELWRSAPYLHDGSAATLREVLTSRNANYQHGNVQHLKPGEIDDLVAFLLSL